MHIIRIRSLALYKYVYYYYYYYFLTPVLNSQGMEKIRYIAIQKSTKIKLE